MESRLATLRGIVRNINICVKRLFALKVDVWRNTAFWQGTIIIFGVPLRKINYIIDSSRQAGSASRWIADKQLGFLFLLARDRQNRRVRIK